MSDQNFKIKHRYSERAKISNALTKNLIKINVDEVYETKVLRPCVAKTLPLDAEGLKYNPRYITQIDSDQYFVL